VFEVLPIEPPLDVTAPSRLRPVPKPFLAFAVDRNVGRLGRFLRLLGLDAASSPAWTDADVARVAEAEGRTVLTMDRALLKRAIVTHGRLVRAALPADQLREVVGFFGIRPPFRPFSRCLSCNEPLRPVPKAEVMDRLEPLTRRHYEEFSTCPRCGRVYWAGSHHERMQSRLSSILGPTAESL